MKELQGLELVNSAIILRFPEEPPAELYPGGPAGIRVAATVPHVWCRCGHPAEVCLEIPITLEFKEDCPPETLERLLREMARQSARGYAARNDCLRCASPTPEAA